MHKTKIKIEYVHICNNLKPDDLTNKYIVELRQLMSWQLINRLRLLTMCQQTLTECQIAIDLVNTNQYNQERGGDRSTGDRPLDRRRARSGRRSLDRRLTFRPAAIAPSKFDIGLFEMVQVGPSRKNI